MGCGAGAAATMEAQRWEADLQEAAGRLRLAQEAAREAARARRAEEAAREAQAARAREAEATEASVAGTTAQAADPTASEAKATEAPEVEGATEAAREPVTGGVPETHALASEPSRTPPPRGQQSPFSSATPLNAEPLLQALATANSTLLDRLSA